MRRWLFALVMGLAGLAPLHAQEGPKMLLEKKGELTEKDEFDKMLKQSYSKSIEFKMEAGKGYRIELQSKDFDSFLRLENSEGKNLAVDDDSGGNLNAKLVYSPEKDGTYKIIVTTADKEKTGSYTLRVREATKVDMLMVRARNMLKAPPDEQSKLVKDVLEHLKSQGKKLKIPDDAQLAMGVGQTLERFKSPAVGDYYRQVAKAFEEADEERLNKFSKTLYGIVRRMELPGNPIDVHGTTMEGKKLDWNAYRGKVVLVDFWATWCGPCRAEFPNMRKMYDGYKGKGFEIVGINIDQDRGKLDTYQEKEKLPWTNIYDPDSKEKALSDFYGITAIPLAILVDKDGKVISMSARGGELRRLLERELGPLPEPKEEKKSEQ